MSDRGNDCVDVFVGGKFVNVHKGRGRGKIVENAEEGEVEGQTD